MNKNFYSFAIAGSLVLALYGAVPHNTQAATQAGVTIVVTRSDDPTPTSLSTSCGYSSTGIAPAADGCSFRRAVLEAAARPATDRPITITFNLANNDPNKDLLAPGTWTIRLSNALPPLRAGNNTIDKNGQVTIDGASQPGGRTGSPPIIIDMADSAWSIETGNNVFRNLSIKRTGGFQVKGGTSNNLFERLWMGLSDDGQNLELREPANPVRMAIGGGIQIFSNSTGNVIRFNRFLGSFTPAINIDTGSSSNQVLSNTIGLRADGTAPIVPESIRCIKSLDFDPANWYGGWGIDIAGTGQTIQGNVVAALHRPLTSGETPAPAIDIAGVNHVIANNIIGVDQAGNEIGTCGNGIKVAGSNTRITDNVLVGTRAGFESASGAPINFAILANDSSPTFGRIAVRGNLVKDGPGDVYNFGPAIPDLLKSFRPARVTSLSASAISGASGAGSPCPNCLIDVYTDDADNTAESLAYLGSAVADANGNWSLPLSQALPSGVYVRTMSTPQSSGVIGSYGAGTTSKTSILYVPLSTPLLSGSLAVNAGVTETYVISVSELNIQTPVSYTLEVSDYANSVSALNNTVISLPLRWTTAGVKTIKVTATNDLGSVSSTFTIQVTGGASSGKRVLLPLLQR